MKKFTEPKQNVPVTGTIIEVAQAFGKEGEFTAIKIMTNDRVSQSFALSTSWESIKSYLFVGNMVVIESEECLANITGWLNEHGEEVGHTRDHSNVTGVTELIEMFMVTDGVPDRVIDRIMQKRDEISKALQATTPTRVPKETSNEGKIVKLLAQYEATSNTATKENLAARLEALGYAFPSETPVGKPAGKAAQ